MRYIFFLSVFLASYVFVAAFNSADWDLWARLAVGKAFFYHGSLLKQDIFAYTPTKPLWIDHEWLSGVVFYFFAERLGAWGLSFLKLILLFSQFLAAYHINRLKFPEQNHYKPIYYIFFLYTLMFSFGNTIQSHCFTFIFFGLWLYLLELVKSGNNKVIWIFPAAMILWANLHGGFPAGIGIPLLYAVGEALNERAFCKYLWIMLLSTLAVMANPYGIEYFPYMVEALTMPRPFLTEWMPLNFFGDFGTAFGFKIFAILALFSLPYILIDLIKKRNPLNYAEILILVVTFAISLRHIMHTSFFIIAFAAYGTGYLYQASAFYRENFMKAFVCKFCIKIPHFLDRIAIYTKNAKDFLIYSLIIVFGVLTIHFVPLKIKVENSRFPARAVKFIEINKLSGNLLVLFNWGSYALWKLYPQCKVAVDGRYDGVYPESLISQVARFHYSGADWHELMTNYDTDLILMNTDYEAYKNLIRLDGWKIVYKDDFSAVFLPSSKAEKLKGSLKMPEEYFNAENEMFKSKFFN